MNLSNKQRLEALIQAQRPLGTYVFDIDRCCFVSDTPIELYITKISEGEYRPALYYFDGYEVAIPEDNATLYQGNAAEAMRLAIDDFNNERFEGYPVIFEFITCEILPQ